jgi:hypothetical protein
MLHTETIEELMLIDAVTRMNALMYLRRESRVYGSAHSDSHDAQLQWMYISNPQVASSFDCVLVSGCSRLLRCLTNLLSLKPLDDQFNIELQEPTASMMHVPEPSRCYYMALSNTMILIMLVSSSLGCRETLKQLELQQIILGVCASV